jgi:hypothetical protein
VALNQARTCNCENTRNTLAPRARVHASSVTLSVNGTNQGILITSHASGPRQGSRQNSGLVKAALFLAVGMQRDRHYHSGFVEGTAAAGVSYQLCQARRHVWPAFQFQNASAQSAFVETARARRGVYIFVTPATADQLSLIVRDLAQRNDTTLPADRFRSRENWSALPTAGADHAIGAGFDTAGAYFTGLGIDHREGGVV